MIRRFAASAQWTSVGSSDTRSPQLAIQQPSCKEEEEPVGRKDDPQEGEQLQSAPVATATNYTCCKCQGTWPPASHTSYPASRIPYPVSRIPHRALQTQQALRKYNGLTKVQMLRSNLIQKDANNTNNDSHMTPSENEIVAPKLNVSERPSF